MKKRRQLLFVALCLGLLRPAVGGGQAAPPSLPTQKGPYPFPTGPQFPLTLVCLQWRGLPMVSGSINGKPQQFVIATGLNAVTVAPRAQAALNLPTAQVRYRVAALDNFADAPAVIMKELTLGAISFNETQAVTLNVWGLLSPQVPPNAPQCWAGTPLLSAFQVTIDLKNNALTLDSPKAAAPKSDDAITLPLVLRNGRIFTRLTVPGAKPVLMLVDTGAPATILPLTTFDKLKPKPLRTQAVRLARQRKARAAQWLLPALQIGEATLKDLPVVSVAPEDPKDFDPDFGLLGMDILRRYRVTINYARLKMTLIPY